MTTKNNKASDFFTRLREVRGDLSQREFAKSIGITSQQTYANYEKGRLPKTPIIQKIAQQYGVNMEWLISGSPPKYTKGSDAVKRQDYEGAFEALIYTMPIEDLTTRMHDLIDEAVKGDINAISAIKATLDIVQNKLLNS